MRATDINPKIREMLHGLADSTKTSWHEISNEYCGFCEWCPRALFKVFESWYRAKLKKNSQVTELTLLASQTQDKQDGKEEC